MFGQRAIFRENPLFLPCCPWGGERSLSAPWFWVAAGRSGMVCASLPAPPDSPCWHWCWPGRCREAATSVLKDRALGEGWCRAPRDPPQLVLLFVSPAPGTPWAQTPWDQSREPQPHHPTLLPALSWHSPALPTHPGDAAALRHLNRVRCMAAKGQGPGLARGGGHLDLSSSW